MSDKEQTEPDESCEDTELRRSGRIRTHTEAGANYYEDQMNNSFSVISRLEGDLESKFNSFDLELPENPIQLNVIRSDFMTSYEKYSAKCKELLNFLSQQNTEQNAASQEKITSNQAFFHKKFENCLQQIEFKLNKISNSKSNSKSRSSKSFSSTSSSSSRTIILKQRLKAEAAETSLQYAISELSLKREAAEREKEAAVCNAKLELLAIERDAAIAKAELKAAKEELLEDLDDNEDFGLNSCDNLLDGRVKGSNPTNENLRLDPQMPINDSHLPSYPKQNLVDSRVPVDCHPLNASGKEGYLMGDNHTTEHIDFKSHDNFQFGQPVQQSRDYIDPLDCPPLNGFDREIVRPKIHNQPPSESANIPFDVIGLSNYLIKRDLLMHSGIEIFQDDSETYQTWKDSFKAMKNDLKPVPREELGLLIKYLGPESKKFANSIKNANAGNPLEAIHKIWQRLDDRYGSAVLVETSLKARLSKFPDISPKDNKKLFDLADLLAEFQCRMDDPVHNRSLSYFNSSCGMKPIIAELPYFLQERWVTRAAAYNARHNVSYPPFSFLVDFINEVSRIRNDPGFIFVDQKKETTTPRKDSSRKGQTSVHVRKTEFSDSMPPISSQCMLHDEAKHSVNECKSFQKLSLNERKKLLKDYRFCFKCCSSTAHNFNDCKNQVNCKTCGKNHPTALHYEFREARPYNKPMDKHGGEPPVVSKCTEICNGFEGRSCSKILLVNVFPKGKPYLSVKMYALLDDQSNSTLARAEFFDSMHIPWSSASSYSLSSCAGKCTKIGRRAANYVVEACDGSARLDLPQVIECDDIPDERQEIPTPEILQYHSHLKSVSIPPLDPDAQILLLIGRDLPEAHHVEEQRVGKRGTPFSHKTTLGWVVVGNMCLEKVHPPRNLKVMKTDVDRRGTIFEDCPLNFTVQFDESHLFLRESLDNTIGQSIEDRKFLEVMDKEFTKDPDLGNWTAPLPFKTPRPVLPNNRPVAMKRAAQLQASLRRNPQKCTHFVTFMQNIFDCGFAEKAPPLDPSSECWYLPIFGVYHPKKPDKIRVVFDSSCKHEGVSLNNVLMQGPDLLNRLDGVLLRFRKDAYAIMADIEQMFFQFYVNENHRDYLRFLWHKDNNPDLELIEYRMKVHVFGNSPSPAVANYGLRKCVNIEQQIVPEEVKEFVTRNFYVDDGLTSFPTVDKAVDVLIKTQNILQENGNLRLHKIASNSQEIMAHFQSADLVKTIQPLELSRDDLPVHQSLGLGWELSTDTFTYKPSEETKPFTKRGLLSTVNGLFDPLGFIAPIVVQGKMIMREAVEQNSDWDDPLHDKTLNAWKNWIGELGTLSQIHIPRCMVPISFSNCVEKGLHIFCDASMSAIAACAYLRGVDSNKNIHVGFIFGKCKVAPKTGHTIPRLELCASVLAVEMGEMLSRELDMPLQDITYYSDSNVVLGYLSNEQRRFYVYVSNRVARIRKSSSPNQWRHVKSELNPADEGTRTLSPNQLMNSLWLNGPTFLYETEDKKDDVFPLVEPNNDLEVRPLVQVHKTEVTRTSLGLSRFKRFSTWRALVKAIWNIRNMLRRKLTKFDPISKLEVEHFIIEQNQREYYVKEMLDISLSKQISRNSSILKLSPYIDSNGILRVGGRLKHANMTIKEKMPVLIPGKSYLAKLLVDHYHKECRHQGRHFTEGTLRNAGFWITDGKRLIANVIHHCVTCRKLRGKLSVQKMADLPEDRIAPSPPFSFVGVDVFGPWNVSTRKTRGGSANSKRWAVLFTCLYSRAVHIEVIEEMSTSSFINAMRRFIAIRGKVTVFRSDRGTNFVGAVSELGMNSINVEDAQIATYLDKEKTTWRFNPPHASHFGGVWERMIGIARRILDAMLLDHGYHKLTHEILVTFMAEVTAIINSRPIVPVSTDPEDPFILTPGVLLTQKTTEIVPDFQDIGLKDMYQSQWKMVQVLANTFAKRWKSEFLSMLQPRIKWSHKCSLVLIVLSESLKRELDENVDNILLNPLWTNADKTVSTFKAPSHLLLNEKREFEAFGYEAEKRYADLHQQGRHQRCFFFRRFKSKVQGQQSLKLENVIKDETGKSMPAIKIFSFAIRFLKSHLLNALRMRRKEISMDDIKWVVTVPAFWNDALKQFMRHAAVQAGIPGEQLKIGLEPEVASILCQNLQQTKGAERLPITVQGASYVVADIGGGKTDIVYHERRADGRLKEMCKGGGCVVGTGHIDNAFLQFLVRLLGAPVVREFIEECKLDFLDLLRSFDSAKKYISPVHRNQLSIRIPAGLERFCRSKHNGETIANVVTKSVYRDRVHVVDDKMKIDYTLTVEFFRAGCSEIARNIRNVIRNSQAKNTAYLILVGGMADSPLLQDVIRQDLEKSTNIQRIIVPPEPDIAVLKGAVMFGHQPSAIFQRVIRYTYGLRKAKLFNPDLHPGDKLVTFHGIDFITDVFCPFITSGTRAPVGFRSYDSLTSIEPFQKVIEIDIYFTPETEPVYVTDKNVHLLGKVQYQIPNPSKEERTIYIEFIFGDTELVINITDRKTASRFKNTFPEIEKR